STGSEPRPWRRSRSSGTSTPITTFSDATLNHERHRTRRAINHGQGHGSVFGAIHLSRRPRGRRGLVRRPQTASDLADHRFARRRERRRVLLQPRRPARALQHARHAQGAVHRLRHAGARLAVGHGARALLGGGGHGKADIVPSVNFFSKVTADAEGRFAFAPGHSRPGSYVELRAEMNVLVVLAAVPHALDPAPTYLPRPVELVVVAGDPPPADDPCRVSREETKRAFENTERYFA